MHTVLCPFPDISAHVVKPPGIGLPVTNRVSTVILVTLPCHLLTVIAAAEVVPFPRPAGIFPFGFAWQVLYGWRVLLQAVRRGPVHRANSRSLQDRYYRTRGFCWGHP